MTKRTLANDDSGEEHQEVKRTQGERNLQGHALRRDCRASSLQGILDHFTRVHLSSWVYMNLNVASTHGQCPSIRISRYSVRVLVRQDTLVALDHAGGDRGGNSGRNFVTLRSVGRDDAGLAGAERGDVSILEDVILLAILEAIDGVVVRGHVIALEHVVLLGLQPVHGVLGANRAVAWIGCLVLVGISTASPSKHGGSDGRGVRRARDIAMEAVHVHLLSTALVRVYPEPRTSTSTCRARGHRRGDAELGVERPDTGVVDTEDDKVVRLDICRIGLVCNSKRTAHRIGFIQRVELGGGLPRTGPVASIAGVASLR